MMRASLQFCLLMVVCLFELNQHHAQAEHSSCVSSSDFTNSQLRAKLANDTPYQNFLSAIWKACQYDEKEYLKRVVDNCTHGQLGASLSDLVGIRKTGLRP